MANFQGMHPPHLPTPNRHQAIALPAQPNSFLSVFPSCASAMRNEFTESGIPPSTGWVFIRSKKDPSPPTPATAYKLPVAPAPPWSRSSSRPLLLQTPRQYAPPASSPSLERRAGRAHPAASAAATTPPSPAPTASRGPARPGRPRARRAPSASGCWPRGARRRSTPCAWAAPPGTSAPTGWRRRARGAGSRWTAPGRASRAARTTRPRRRARRRRRTACARTRSRISASRASRGRRGAPWGGVGGVLQVFFVFFCFF